MGEAELVLRPGLNRWGWGLGFAAFMALPAGAMLYRGVGWGWFYLGLTGLVAGSSAWIMAAPRLRLRLSPAGFAYGTVRRRYAFRWSEVASFGVAEFAAHRWVVFSFAAGYSGDERVRAVNQRFGGFDRFLPDIYGMRAAALAELLEGWRLRYGAQA
jgi:hypothetical protein